MKLILPLILTVLMLSGCEKIKDATSIKVDTNFEVDFPVTVTDVKSTASSFSVTEVLSVADNGDLEDYISEIDEINLSDLVITIDGLSGDQTISTLSLDAEGVGNVLTLSNITMNNNSFTPEVSESVLNQMGNKLRSEGSLTLTVSGEASGPMTFIVRSNMDAQVVVATL